MAAGVATVIIAGFGVVRLLRPREDPLACALAAYAIGLLALHSLWLAVARPGAAKPPQWCRQWAPSRCRGFLVLRVNTG